MKESLWIQPCSTKPFEQSLLLALPERLCPRGSMNLSCSDLPSFPKNLNSEEGSSPSAPVRVCTPLGPGANPSRIPAPRYSRNTTESSWELPGVPSLSQGCRRGHRGQLQAGTEVPPGHCCPAHLAGSSDGSWSHHRQSKSPRGLGSALNFKIQEQLHSVWVPPDLTG